MEELQRKKMSRKGYRSHLTRLIRKIDAVIDSEIRPTEKDITTLTSSIEQFNEHAAFLQEADQEIANTITGEDELEAEIIKSAAIQETISDKISHIKRILNRLTTPAAPTTLSVKEFVPLSSPTGTVSTPSVSRLPKLNLPTFTGDPLNGKVS